eukprot:Skav229549  [mRNA]  locus=scaffold568:275738:288499:+ [translate_table: standard]
MLMLTLLSFLSLFFPFRIIGKISPSAQFALRDFDSSCVSLGSVAILSSRLSTWRSRQTMSQGYQGSSAGEIVKLNVYSPSGGQHVAYHSGVEVFGGEYVFGGGNTSFSGVTVQRPKVPPPGSGWVFYQTVEVGACRLSRDDAMRAIQELRAQFPASGYDLMARNCNHFADALCQRLCNSGIPSWVNRLAGIGNTLRSAVGAAPAPTGPARAEGAGGPAAAGLVSMDAVRLWRARPEHVSFSSLAMLAILSNSVPTWRPPLALREALMRTAAALQAADQPEPLGIRRNTTRHATCDEHLVLRCPKMPHAAAAFCRVLVMPNLVPPVTTTEAALAYRERILLRLPKTTKEGDFVPLMTRRGLLYYWLYLTDNTMPEEIVKAKASGHIYALKLYPAGATTNSDFGVTDYERIMPALKKMEELGILLLVHGESTDQAVDIFDREADFYEKAIFKGGINPHFYCLPILKTEKDRQKLLQCAVENSKFFLGTDSAPHTVGKKECACSANKTKEAVGRLDSLEDFVAKRGAAFYGLPPPNTTRVLARETWKVPEQYPFGHESLGVL